MLQSRSSIKTSFINNYKICIIRIFKILQKKKMERLSLVANQLSGKGKSAGGIVDSSVDFYRFYDLFSQEERELAKKVRTFAETEIAPIINEYYEKATFPDVLIDAFAKSKLTSICLSKPYGEGKPPTAFIPIITELARVDASMASFFTVHAGLVMYTIEALGDEEQKKRYLPDFRDMKKLSGWGLTEPLIGSDASNLGTTATKVDGGYKINGNKRWIGNANRDYLICWARDTQTNKIGAFIINVKSPGVRIEVIQHKLSLRVVQNCHITLTDVFVPDEDRLTHAKDFASTGEVLLHSRVCVCAIAVGIALGIYDNCIKYLNNRTQFGVKLVSFQLVQDKLVRMMANIQAMLLMVWRISNLYQEGKATIGMVGMAKAWCTKTGREVAALGREVLGGNGIIIDNYVMKGFADMEAVHTYEGTYDINTLVAGRELTGKAAFKAGK